MHLSALAYRRLKYMSKTQTKIVLFWIILVAFEFDTLDLKKWGKTCSNLELSLFGIRLLKR